jgi:hypothetical protein
MASNKYHFVISLQFRKAGEFGVSANTIEGTITAASGTTRQDLYYDVYKRACKALGIADGVTMFCMIEPNSL